jgi:hypothetical protein
MLQKIGLLPPCNLEQLPFAYAMYKRDDEKGFKLSLQFKRTFSIDVKVRFLGVWYVIRPIDQLPVSHSPLPAGTPYNPSGGFQNTCRSVVQTTLSPTFATRWLLTNVVSSLFRPFTLAEKLSVRGRTPRFPKTASPSVKNVTRRLGNANGLKSLTSMNSISTP